MVPLETAVTAQIEARNLFKKSPGSGNLHRRAEETEKEEKSELKGKESSVKDRLLLGY